MKKENENIHLFIIEQEYKRSKAKQNGSEGFLRKAETPTLPKQNHSFVIQKLQEMHPNFGVIEEPESLQTTEEPKQVDKLHVEEQQDAADVLDLLASLQEMRTEEQELHETKEDLLTKERDMQSKLVKEIDKKKKAIDELKAEIPAIQNRCKQLREVLGVDIYA